MQTVCIQDVLLGRKKTESSSVAFIMFPSSKPFEKAKLVQTAVFIGFWQRGVASWPMEMLVSLIILYINFKVLPCIYHFAISMFFSVSLRLRPVENVHWADEIVPSRQPEGPAFLYFLIHPKY